MIKILNNFGFLLKLCAAHDKVLLIFCWSVMKTLRIVRSDYKNKMRVDLKIHDGQ